MLSHLFFPQVLQRVPARRNVFAELERFHGEVDQFFGGFRSVLGNETPPLSASSTDDEVVVKVELPGIAPEDVEVSVEDNVLRVKGERSDEEVGEGEKYHRQERWTGQFSRSLGLPFQVEADAVEAEFNHGVLTIKLPRAEANKPKKISVKSA